jgi:endonuclease YncB( thermonuclease family)
MCSAIDGDTLRCNGNSYRLQAVDAPERPGTCRKGRVCAPGDYHASKAALARLIANRRVTIVDTGPAAWGRRQAVVYANGLNVACELLRGRYVIYQARYDRASIVRKDCGL